MSVSFYQESILNWNDSLRNWFTGTVLLQKYYQAEGKTSEMEE